MVIRPGVVSYAAIDFRVWVTSAFGTELPNRPLVAVFAIEELDKVGKRVAVGELRVSAAGAGCCDD